MKQSGPRNLFQDKSGISQVRVTNHSPCQHYYPRSGLVTSEVYPKWLSVAPNHPYVIDFRRMDEEMSVSMILYECLLLLVR